MKSKIQLIALVGIAIATSLVAVWRAVRKKHHQSQGSQPNMAELPM
jgi:hypothetical protein